MPQPTLTNPPATPLRQSSLRGTHSPIPSAAALSASPLTPTPWPAGPSSSNPATTNNTSISTAAGSTASAPPTFNPTSRRTVQSPQSTPESDTTIRPPPTASAENAWLVRQVREQIRSEFGLVVEERVVEDEIRHVLRGIVVGRLKKAIRVELDDGGKYRRGRGKAVGHEEKAELLAAAAMLVATVVGMGVFCMRRLRR